MWQTNITIGGSYREAARVLQRKLDEIEGLYCARSDTKKRTMFSLACKEGDVVFVKSLVDNAVCDLIVTNFKFQYLCKAVRRKRTPAVCALLSSLLYYDCERERTVILRALDDLYEYAVDGFVAFRMKSVVRSWQEIADMTAGLLSADAHDDDLYAVALYLLGSRECDVSLFIADSSDLLITNATKGGMVDVVELYHDPVLDAINTVIANGAKEVIVESKKVDKRLISALENIVKIKVL